jgi:hypothetical protein
MDLNTWAENYKLKKLNPEKQDKNKLRVEKVLPVSSEI